MDLDEFETDYRDLVGDVMRAGYIMYERALRDWYAFLDESPYASRVAELESPVDFEEWYAAGLTTVRSMVGSGELDWATDQRKWLGQNLALFRYFSSTKESSIEFCHNFLYTDNSFDVNIAELNSQIFQPFSRKLLKELLRLPKPSTDVPVPASDRIVRLDHNGSTYRDTMSQLGVIVGELEQSNSIGSDEPEQRERVIAELSAGRRLLQAAQVRAEVAWELISKALRWVGTKAAEAAITELIKAALVAVAILLGIKFLLP